MNNPLAPKIQLSRAKRRTNIKNFNRKFRNVIATWQISDASSPNAEKFKHLDDVAGKLLRMSLSVKSSGDNSNENSNVTHPEAQSGRNQMLSGGKDLTANVPRIIKKVGWEISEEDDDVIPCSENVGGNEITQDEESCTKIVGSDIESCKSNIRQDGVKLDKIGVKEGNKKLNPSDVGGNEDRGQGQFYFVGNNGNLCPLVPVKLHDNPHISRERCAKKKSCPKKAVELETDEVDPEEIVESDLIRSSGSSSLVKKPPSISKRHRILRKRAVSPEPLGPPPPPTPSFWKYRFMVGSHDESERVNEPLYKIVRSVPLVQPYVFHVLSDDKVLLGLKYRNDLFFRGKLSVSVVFGTVEVLGFQIKSHDVRNSYTLYSPKGMSLLGIRASQPHQSTPVDYSELSAFGLDSRKIKDIQSLMSDVDCLLLAQNASSSFADFISDHSSLKLFPPRPTPSDGVGQTQTAEGVLHCQFVTPDSAENFKLYTEQPHWGKCFEDIAKSGEIRATVCGGQSVGKSTFLRFLVNRLLSKYNEVLYLDFDPGQSEFTVPGCVSAVLVNEPLLGPNFTHLHSAQRMVYVGEVNVSNCPARYLQCVQHIVEFCRSQAQFSDIPWVVNTMGFSKGLGVELTVNVIRMVRPSDVIQIQSSHGNRNFPELLESPYVLGYQCALWSVANASCRDLLYNFHELPSAAEELNSEATSRWGMDAHRLRDLVILSYLSQMLKPTQQFLTEVVPFRLPFSGLKLCICHEAVPYSQYLVAMNCSLVALCSVGDEDTLVPSDPQYPHILLKLPATPCLGFGLVRGIDMEAKKVYLISPLSEDELCQINCLVLGRITIPSDVLFAARNMTGLMPYVTSGDEHPVGQNLRKSRSVAQLHRNKYSSKRV